MRASYYVGIVVRHGHQFYLSKKKPGTTKDIEGPEWFAYMGPQLAFRFKTEDEAVKGVNSYVKGRADILGGIGQVSFFKPKS